MPFLLERARAKRLTEGEMRSIFDEIDTGRSGAVGRPEFVYTFCGKLGLLSQEEAEAVLSVLDRHGSRKSCFVFAFFLLWRNFVCLFASDTAQDQCAIRNKIDSFCSYKSFRGVSQLAADNTALDIYSEELGYCLPPTWFITAQRTCSL